MIVLNNYDIYNKNNTYYAISKENHVCPFCHGALKVRGSRLRKIIYSETETRIFYIRRLQCTNCGVLHNELPDLFIPHKHYSRSIIETALSGLSEDCPAENSTIQRWSKEKELLCH